MITTTFSPNGVKQKEPFILATNQKVLLYTVGDVHYGDEGCAEGCFVETLKWAMDRGAYFIGVGDYMDTMAYSQRKILAPLRDDTKKQVDEAVRGTLDKFIDLIGFTKGRWIGMVRGNHYWEFIDRTNSDQYLCEAFKCPYLGTMAMVRIIPKDMPKGHPEASSTICVHHGVGQAQLIGTHLHRLEHQLKWLDADIYVMGHTHAKVAAPIDEQRISPDGVHYHRTKLLVRTGSWLKGYDSHEPLETDEPAYLSDGSYIEQKAYMPSSMGGACIGIGYEKIHRSQYYRPTVHFSI